MIASASACVAGFNASLVFLVCHLILRDVCDLPEHLRAGLLTAAGRVPAIANVTSVGRSRSTVFWGGSGPNTSRPRKKQIYIFSFTPERINHQLTG
jgi:hypothetical protein